MAIYRDLDTGAGIATHSMLKTFRRCPKQAQYKYIMRLKPKRLGKPLRRGTWAHRLLEVYSKYLVEHSVKKQRDPKIQAAAIEAMWEEHQLLSAKFNEYFDEEKDELGDLPTEIARMMRSYFWHYAAETWVVHEVEFLLETAFPDGTVYRGKIDLLIENQFGLWIVDHKTHKTLPNLDFRLLDAQSALYIWAAIRNKIPVEGHIWNYVRWKPPTIPGLLKDGSRLYARDIETDYPTLLKAIKGYGLNPRDYKHWLIRLRNQRYTPGEMQLSPFFRRDFLEKSPTLLRQVAQEGYHTAKRMNSYPFDRDGFVERVPDRSCTFSCSYTDICATELFGGNIQPLLKNYTVGDPLDYYYDDDSKKEKVDG